jgi:enediyne biosynthesis protein E8
MTAPGIDRRAVLGALTTALAVLAAGRFGTAAAAEPGPGTSAGAASARTKAAAGAAESATAQTLEAFADTLVPGERRFPGDLAIAGAVSGPGAVQAGVMDVLTSPRLPLAPLLPEIAALLDARALAYAVTHLILLPPTSPAFVGLSFADRTALVGGLFGPDDLDRPVWQVLSLVVGLAFDTAAHLDTREALAAGHPGLAWLRFPAPDADGLWRFPQFSYGRPLAALHPATTPSGSPA